MATLPISAQGLPAFSLEGSSASVGLVRRQSAGSFLYRFQLKADFGNFTPLLLLRMTLHD